MVAAPPTAAPAAAKGIGSGSRAERSARQPVRYSGRRPGRHEHPPSAREARPPSPPSATGIVGWDMMDQLSLVPYEGAGGGGGDGDGGRYKECMRNHAAAMGGQAFDGCGEYMPSSPDSLKCAACGCHRSFHRRAAGGSSSSSCGGVGIGGAPPFFFRPPPQPAPLPALPAPPQPHYHHHQAALQAFLPSVPAAGMPPHLALPYHAVPPSAAAAAPWLARSGSETPPRADDFGVGVPGLGVVVGSGGGGGGGNSGSGSFGRKRFRTKFTPEQKERMREFAEKQGWRIQRNDDGELERFCDEIGVKRQVLKVWMHNHKNQLASTAPSSATAAAVGINDAASAGIGVGIGIGMRNPTAAAGIGIGCTGTGVLAGDVDGDDDDDDDDDTDDSPPRAAVSSPSPSSISV